MRWFEYQSSCQCGESQQGMIPAEERFNIRCELCARFQRPLLFGRYEDDLEYDEYLEELCEEEEWEEDEDWEDARIR